MRRTCREYDRKLIFVMPARFFRCYNQVSTLVFVLKSPFYYLDGILHLRLQSVEHDYRYGTILKRVRNI